VPPFIVSYHSTLVCTRALGRRGADTNSRRLHRRHQALAEPEHTAEAFGLQRLDLEGVGCRFASIATLPHRQATSELGMVLLAATSSALRGPARPQATAERSSATPSHGRHALGGSAQESLRGAPVLGSKINPAQAAARGSVQRAAGKRASGPVQVQSLLGGLLRRDPTEKVNRISLQSGHCAASLHAVEAPSNTVCSWVRTMDLVGCLVRCLGGCKTSWRRASHTLRHPPSPPCEHCIVRRRSVRATSTLAGRSLRTLSTHAG
jgi:hypothetical protein